MIWSGTNQSRCPVITSMLCTPFNSPYFFPSPLLSYVISACRPEKGSSMESCQDASALELELPTLSLNFRNAIKCLPLSLCPKPLADVVFSNVSLLMLSWEASTHFLENPKNSFSSKLAPITALNDMQEGKKVLHPTWKDHTNFTTLDWVKN